MTDAPSTLYCANHPDTPTTLRCNRCEKPICPRCAVLTPTGYRCNECVRGQQKAFDTANWYDYPLAMIVAGGLAYLGSLVVAFIGFFTIFLAPFAGLVISEAVRIVVRKRRSKRLFHLAAAAAVVGTLPAIVFLVLNLISGSGAILPLVWQGLYTFALASTVYYRLMGIQIR